MSERGSFVTEFVYCPQCLAVVRDVLLRNDSRIAGVAVPYPTGREQPIIAGRICVSSLNEEFVVMEFELGDELNRRLCHPVRIAVLAESGESRVFVFGPQAAACGSSVCMEASR